jgi:flagellar biosynthesis chaperone FliJ
VAREDEVKAKIAQTAAAREALTASTTALREASAARNKFEELRRRERDAVARESERREELELEEVAGNRRDREEEVSFEDV